MKTVNCEKCKRQVFSTDGKNIYVAGLIVTGNKVMVPCGNCGKYAAWERTK